MSDAAVSLDSDLRELRRELHRHPEPAWCEFYTTARLIDALRERDVDIHYGRDIHAVDARLNVPEESTRTEWLDRARQAGADETILDEIREGFTGAVAVFERGQGPTIALRVDIDALPITEADEPDHHPAAEGFRSENEGYMHACGHDAHATIGLGVLDAIVDSDFSGTFKLIFQPSEEQISGAKPMAESGIVDDVEYLLALHIGLDHPSGQVVAGIDGFLAVTQFRAEFAGESAHAGARPEAGANAVQALAAVLGGTQSLHTNGKDEALSLPTEQSVRTALRTQQILAHESGAADTIDPLAGSYYVESLTDDVEDEAREIIDTIDERGGMLRAVDTGYIQQQIQDVAYERQQEIENGERVIVGVNKYQVDDDPQMDLESSDEQNEARQVDRLEAVKADRDEAAVETALAAVAEAASGDANVLPPVIEAVKAYASVQEICDVFREEFGEYQPGV